LTSDEFTEWLLKEERVAVVPGSAFGEGGENHIRIAYCKSYEQIEIALERMQKFLRKF
jgi:aminotransferase